MSKHRCIFCQTSGRLSREHIWADWLRNFVPRRDDRSTHRIAGSDTENKILRGKLDRPGDIMAQRLRIVCKSCNEGWMSQMQERTKPHLVGLIRDGWTALDEDAQRILAAWATMFTMVFEYADPPTATVTQADRTYFMIHKAPPPNWLVWIGRVNLFPASPANANHHGCLFNGRDLTGLQEIYQFQSTGFSVGSIFFQTTMINLPDIQFNAPEVAKQFDLRVIHPFGGPILNDAPTILNLANFYAVSNCFADALGLPSFGPSSAA